MQSLAQILGESILIEGRIGRDDQGVTATERRRRFELAVARTALGRPALDGLHVDLERRWSVGKTISGGTVARARPGAAPAFGASFLLTPCSRLDDTRRHRTTPDDTGRHVRRDFVPGRTNPRIRCPKGRGGSNPPSRTNSHVRVFRSERLDAQAIGCEEEPRRPVLRRCLERLDELAVVQLVVETAAL